MINFLRWLYNDITPHKRLLSYFIFISYLIRAYTRADRPEGSIWLIGESRGDCVKDNGYHFFRYCQTRHPEKKVYFVINESSIHYPTMANDPAVLSYGSRRHINTYIHADVCFYTHTCSDFIHREQFHTYHKDKKLVFLHHGVLGFKKFNKKYLKHKNIMDLFIVGNRLEKDILENQVGVSAHKIKVSGYARYDAMINSVSPDKLQLVYIPTHRNWLRVSPKDFRQTDFYRQVDNFINSPALHRFLLQNNIVFKMHLHPIMQKYANQFASKCQKVEISTSSDESVLQLICDSHLLITDYSSVAWDHLYLGKPVLFYRFDLRQYLDSRDSYVQLEKALVGDVFYQAEEVVAAIIKSWDQGFTLDAEHRAYRGRIMPALDHNNCERIYNEVSKL